MRILGFGAKTHYFERTYYIGDCTVQQKRKEKKRIDRRTTKESKEPNYWRDVYKPIARMLQPLPPARLLIAISLAARDEGAFGDPFQGFVGGAALRNRHGQRAFEKPGDHVHQQRWGR